LRQIHLGTNEDGDPVTSCVVDPVTSPPPKQQPKPKLPPAQARALELLMEAINRAGRIPPANPHIPPGTACVAEKLWRSYCYAGQISDSDKPDAKQKAFSRAAKALVAAGRVGKWGDEVWIVS
jgi:hypothetical protein